MDTQQRADAAARALAKPEAELSDAECEEAAQARQRNLQYDTHDIILMLNILHDFRETDRYSYSLQNAAFLAACAREYLERRKPAMQKPE